MIALLRQRGTLMKLHVSVSLPDADVPALQDL
jgi:hypothetical protein